MAVLHYGQPRSGPDRGPFRVVDSGWLGAGQDRPGAVRTEIKSSLTVLKVP